MKITVLIENTKNPIRNDLLHEHGLSLYLEIEKHRILFDTGASNRFIQNAIRLGIDLESIDAVVLSHGHFDHGGGISAFMKLNRLAPLYAGPGALEAHFAKLLGMVYIPVGIKQRETNPFRARLVAVDVLIEIFPRVFILPNIILQSNPPGDINTFYRNTSRGKEQDAFQHEVILVIEEADGIVVATGCSHKGILNIVQSVESYFPTMPIKAVVGGMHMTNPLTKKLLQSEQDIQKTGAMLFENSRIAKIYSGHCTGNRAYEILRKELKDKLCALTVGMQIEL
jgi:7,8-dihydropterin-6-yl-methyl-4-(beta-D-ribofuranosyl)aminobenzene 5'-phosphate synthase